MQRRVLPLVVLSVLLLLGGSAAAAEGLLRIENWLNRPLAVDVNPQRRQVRVADQASEAVPTELAANEGAAWQVPTGEYVVAWAGSEKGFSVAVNADDATELRLLYGGNSGRDLVLARVTDGRLGASQTLLEGPLPSATTRTEAASSTPASGGLTPVPVTPTPAPLNASSRQASAQRSPLEIANEGHERLNVGVDEERRAVYVFDSRTSLADHPLEPGEMLQFRVPAATYSVRWLGPENYSFAYASVRTNETTALDLLTTGSRLDVEIRENGVVQRTVALGNVNPPEPVIVRREPIVLRQDRVIVQRPVVIERPVVVQPYYVGPQVYVHRSYPRWSRFHHHRFGSRYSPFGYPHGFRHHRYHRGSSFGFSIRLGD